MAIIETIIKQSPWLLDEKAIEADVHLSRMAQFPLIHRERQFLDHNFADGVYMLTGPRQIGKTTVVKMLIKKLLNTDNHANFLYFNCDLLDNKQAVVELVEKYLEEFPSNKQRYIILDEISSVKDSVLAIKYLIDSGHSEKLTYILTGSSSVNIKKTGEYLPGRRGKGIDFNYLPISFKTYLQMAYPNIDINVRLTSDEKDFIAIKQKINLAKELIIYLKTGGFPRVINEYYMNQTIDDDIFTIYRSWITSEIAKAERKEYIAKSILERCLFSLTSDVSYNAFAQDTNVGSHNTIYDYLEFFKNAFVLSVIYNYDYHQKKVNYRINKKIYFNDPFIYAVIEGWLSGKPKQNYDYIDSSLTRSKLIENLVFNYLSRYSDNIYFYRARNEIDFIACDYFLEVKYQNTLSESDYELLKSVKGKKIVVSKEYFQKSDDLLILPVEYLLLCDL